MSFSRGNGLTLESAGRSGPRGPVQRPVRARPGGIAEVVRGVLARLAEHGIEHEPVETYGNGVRHVEVLDPDGNSLSLAQVPAQ
jgi:hypothetical protein